MANGNNRNSNSLASKLVIPDWRMLNEDQPYLNRITGEYCIVVATDIENIDANTIDAATDIVRRKGVENLYRFYNKRVPNIERPLDAAAEMQRVFDASSAPNYHLDPRPCSTLRFLVCIDAEVFDSIPNADPQFLIPVPTDNVPFVATYLLSDLERLINSVAESLENYHREIEKYAGTRVSPDLDLRKESLRLRAALPELKKLFFFNNIPFSDPNREVQLGFDESYGLVNVGIKPTTEYANASGIPETFAERIIIGFQTFKNNVPVKFTRTRKYLSSLKEMESELECPAGRPPWYQFVTKWTHAAAKPIDKFRRSRRGKEVLRTVPSHFPVGVQYKAVKEKDVTSGGSSLYTHMSEDVFGDSSVKTASDVDRQNSALTQDVKIQIAKEREERQDDFLDTLFGSTGVTKELRDSFNNSKEAYEKLLNKVNIKYLTALSLRWATAGGRQERFNKWLFKQGLEALDYVDLKRVTEGCVSADVLAASGIFDDVDETCPDSRRTAANDVFDLVESGQADEECLKVALEDVCPPQAQLFGWRGHAENFLEKTTSNFLAYDKDNLCPYPTSDEAVVAVIPTIKFPSSREVVDITENIHIDFARAVRDTYDELIVGIAKQLLNTLYINFENVLCNWSDMKKFFSGEGEEGTFEDIFGRQIPDGAIGVIKTALRDWGIDADSIDLSLAPGQPGNPANACAGSAQAIENFLDAVSECLNPGELRASLKGKELGMNIPVIEEQAAKYLPGLNPEIMADVLAAAASGIDFGELGERIRYEIAQYVCDESAADRFDDNYRNSLRGRATPEEIERLLQQERDIQNQNIMNLGSLLNSSEKDMFSICADDLPSMPEIPSEAYMANKALDTRFGIIEGSFNREIRDFPYLLLAPEARPAGPGDPQFEAYVSQVIQTESARAIFKNNDNTKFARVIPLTDPVNEADSILMEAFQGFGPLGDQSARQLAESRTTTRAANGSLPQLRVVTSQVLPRLKAALSNQPRDFISFEETEVGSSVQFQLPRVTTQVGDYIEVVTSQLGNITHEIRPVWPTGQGSDLDFFKDSFLTTIPFNAGQAGSQNMIIDSDAPNVPATRLSDEDIQHLGQNHSNFLFAEANPQEHSAQQVLLANYFAEPLARLLAVPEELSRGGSDLGNFFDLAGGNLYRHLSNKILDQITSMFSESPLFTATSPNKKGILDINLDRSAPPNTQCPPGRRPKDNLMRMNFEKQESSRRYKILKQQFERVVTGTQTAPRPLAASTIPSIIRSTARIHVVENALRTIFGLAKFKASEGLYDDRVIDEFSKRFIKQEINDHIVRNAAAYNQLGDSPPVIDFENEVKRLGYENLNELVSDEVDIVFQEIENIMMEEYPDEQRDDVMSTILRQVKQVDVPAKTTFEGARSYPNGLGKIYDDPDESFRPRLVFRSFTERGGPFLNTANFPLINPDTGTGGYFVFERYIEFLPKGRLDPNLQQEVIHKDLLQAKIENATIQAGVLPDGHQIENVNAFRRMFNEGAQELAMSDPSSREVGRTGVPGMVEVGDLDLSVRTSELVQNLNLAGPAAERAFFANLEIQQRRLSEYFEKIVYGVRLSYIHPMGNTGDNADFTEFVNSPEGFMANISGPKRNFPEIEKAYKITVQAENPEDPPVEYFSIPIMKSPTTSLGNYTIGQFYGLGDHMDVEQIQNERNAYNAAEEADQEFWDRTRNNPSGPGFIQQRLGFVNADQVFDFLGLNKQDFLNGGIVNFDRSPHPDGPRWTGGPIGYAKRGGIAGTGRGGLIFIGQAGQGLWRNFKVSWGNLYPDAEWPSPPYEGYTPRGAFYVEAPTFMPPCPPGSVRTFRLEYRGRTSGRTLNISPTLAELEPGEFLNLDVEYFELVADECAIRPKTFSSYGLLSREIFGWDRTIQRFMEEDKDFEIFFNFVLGTKRLLALTSIYCMQSAEYFNPSLVNAFDGTKDSLVSSLYSMQPDIPVESFYAKENPTLAAAGGVQGLQRAQRKYASTSGPSGNAAARTVSYIIKGMAQQMDPSYSFASDLDRQGVLPVPLDFRALMLTAPANIVPFSPLPPIGPMGLAAYAVGLLPGEKTSFENRTLGAQGKLQVEEESCTEELSEQDGPRDGLGASDEAVENLMGMAARGMFAGYGGDE